MEIVTILISISALIISIASYKWNKAKHNLNQLQENGKKLCDSLQDFLDMGTEYYLATYKYELEGELIHDICESYEDEYGYYSANYWVNDPQYSYPDGEINIIGIDNMFKYMQEEARKNDINFDLKLNTSIKPLIENYISKEEDVYSALLLAIEMVSRGMNFKQMNILSFPKRRLWQPRLLSMSKS